MAKRSKKTQMICRPEPEYGGLLAGGIVTNTTR